MKKHFSLETRKLILKYVLNYLAFVIIAFVYSVYKYGSLANTNPEPFLIASGCFVVTIILNAIGRSRKRRKLANQEK